ncbi:MAG: prolyl oligopeptidase family serine peptidase [Clostridia bacterium]|nr:prolyl oligopeptidase family serine peptidase [Clostridia bacterium]
MNICYTESLWNGFKRLDFELDGRKAILVQPDSPVEGNKWLLKTEYFDAFPAFEIEMVKRGYHLAYIENITRWHLDSDDDAKAALCEFLIKEFSLNNKCMPVGMSCGGMHAVYLAAKYPQYIAALYLDAPVLNLLSCPCGVGKGATYMYEEFLNARGQTVSEMINYRNHPIDNAYKIVEHNIPVMLVCGGSDDIVPYDENGKYLTEYMSKNGGNITEIIKPECGHHPHGLEDNAPLIEFTLKYY